MHILKRRHSVSSISSNLGPWFSRKVLWFKIVLPRACFEVVFAGSFYTYPIADFLMLEWREASWACLTSSTSILIFHHVGANRSVPSRVCGVGLFFSLVYVRWVLRRLLNRCAHISSTFRRRDSLSNWPYACFTLDDVKALPSIFVP